MVRGWLVEIGAPHQIRWNVLSRGSSWVWGKPMVFRSWVIQVWGTVPQILNLCYTIPIPIVSWVFMKSTLKCSISVENELFLSQTSYSSVIYDIYCPNSIPDGSAIHAQWPVPSAAIPQKLKCYILSMDQLSLLKTWNPHAMYIIIIPLIQKGSAIHAQWLPSPATPQKSILATDLPLQVVRIFGWTLCHPP